MITLLMYIIDQIFTPSVLKCAFKVWNVFNDNYMYMKTLIDTSCTLTHYHTMPHFDALKINSCGKHCEKRKNGL